MNEQFGDSHTFDTWTRLLGKSPLDTPIEEAEFDAGWMAKIATFVVTAYLMLFGIIVCPAHPDSGFNIFLVLVVVEVCVVSAIWFLASYIPVLETKNMIVFYEGGLVIRDQKERVKNVYHVNENRGRVRCQLAKSWVFHANKKGRAKFWIDDNYIGTFENFKQTKERLQRCLENPEDNDIETEILVE